MPEAMMPKSEEPASSTLSGLSSARRRSFSSRSSTSAVPLPRVLRDHDVLADVPRVVARRHLDRHARQHLPAAVGDARGGPQHHRRVELLGERERLGDEVVGLLAVRRLQHRDLGEPGVVAVVLLVLRRVHAGVVGADDDEAGVDAGERERHERVGGHVEADVLHGDDGAHAGERRAHGGLQRDLLVDAPLAVDALEPGGRLDDLRGRSARVAAGEPGPGAHGAVSDGLVPGEEELAFHGEAHSTRGCIPGATRDRPSQTPAAAAGGRRADDLARRAIIVILTLKNHPQPDLEGFAIRWQNSHGMQRATFTPRMTRTAAE